MRIPLSWVSLFTPLAELLEKHPIRHLAHTYSTHTAEIDAIEEYRIDKVVIAKVLSTEKHPDSKKLSIVRVDQGPFGEETILTGAPNIVEAKYVPVAMVGAILPGDFMISERPLASLTRHRIQPTPNTIEKRYADQNLKESVVIHRT